MADHAKLREDKGGLFIYLRWQGQRHYFTSYLGQVSFRDNLRLAQRSVDVINSEIDKKIFRPERWKRRAKKLFTVKGYSENWLDTIEPGISRATIYDYRNSFKNHINPIIGPEYIEDLNKQKLTLLLNSINREPKGKKNVMSALHRMLQDAFESGHIPLVPIFPKMTGKNEIIKPGIKWLEAPEQFKTLEHIARRHRPIFTFILLTGCRPSEARAFRRQDIQGDHILFAVTFGRNEELKEVKGKKVLPFPMTEGLKELFSSTPKNLSPFVFINPETSRPYTRNFNRIFNRASKKAGINVALNEFGRKSFAMQMLRGMDKGIVSHLLRHQDPRMIDHYAEYQVNPLKSVVDKVQSVKSFDAICTSLDKK